MKNKYTIVKTILSSISNFFLFQVTYYTTISLFFKVKLSRLYLFFIVTLLYHGLLFLSLTILKKEFYLESTKEPLKKINLPIFLSFTRLSSVPTVLFLLLSIREIPLLAVIPFICLVFLTDLFDGFLARKMNQTTRIGRIMDSSGDYFNIIVISILFHIYHLIPAWFFILIFLRLAIQGVGSIILYLRRGYPSLKVSFLGKSSVFATMSLYSFTLLKYWRVPVLGNSTFVKVLEYIAGFIVVLSLFDKLLSLTRSFFMPAGKKKET